MSVGPFGGRRVTSTVGVGAYDRRETTKDESMKGTTTADEPHALAAQADEYVEWLATN